MSRVALYARVSSPRQEKEETIESQLELLLHYAATNRLDVAPELRFVDKAVSGDTLVRPALERLRDAAASGSFQVLLCAQVDRLARNLGAQYVLFNELAQAGVEVRFLQQPDLGNSAQAKLLRNVQGVFAEYERVLIQERMRRGRLYRLRHAQSVPAAAPYGYRFVPASSSAPSRWQVLADEAVVVQELYACYNAGQVSLGQLAQQLNAQGTPSPAGQRWNASTLGRLLRQAAYKGEALYNRHETEQQSVGQLRRNGHGRLRRPRSKARPAAEWIVCAVPALVDEPTWQLAQERLALNARFSPRNSQRPYLLRGLLVCGRCGYSLQGRTRHGRVYYSCTHGGVGRAADSAAHSCSVRADVVEALVWQALRGLLAEPAQLLAAWQQLQAEVSNAAGAGSGWPQRLEQLRQQRSRLLDAYQVGLLSLEELTKRQNPLEQELGELERQTARSPRQQAEVLDLALFKARIEAALNAAEDETKQEVMRLLIERIVVTDEALTVEHIVPTVNDGRLRSACRET